MRNHRACSVGWGVDVNARLALMTLAVLLSSACVFEWDGRMWSCDLTASNAWACVEVHMPRCVNTGQAVYCP